MGVSKNPNSKLGQNHSRKRKRGDGLSVAEVLKQLSENGEAKKERKAPAKGSKKGCMKGKGGPQNHNCNYRGVRQRAWGKWVVEIRAPTTNGKPWKKLWLGTFPTASDAALAYDEAAKQLYGEKAILNNPSPVLLDSEQPVTSTSSHFPEISEKVGDSEDVERTEMMKLLFPDDYSEAPPSTSGAMNQDHVEYVPELEDLDVDKDKDLEDVHQEVEQVGTEENSNYLMICPNDLLWSEEIPQFVTNFCVTGNFDDDILFEWDELLRELT